MLNDADAGSIAGFTIDNQGHLSPIHGSVQPLSGANPSGAAQVQFTPDGKALVVTEKATNLIDTYLVGNNGAAGPPIVQAAPGDTPFGFGFSRDGYLIVSDAFAGVPNGGELASFIVRQDGELQVITPAASTHQTAPCWVVITNSGKFTYTTNTASGNVSGFRINRFTGQLIPLDADGITVDTGGAESVPIDEALSRDSRYLYVLNSGFQQILGFRINPFNGRLEKVAELDGVPPFAFGLAAR